MSKQFTKNMKANVNTYQKPKQQGFIPNQSKKKKQWDKTHTIVFILILFWSIGSILGTLGFINTCSKNTTASNVAYADTLSNFTTVPIDFQVKATVSPSTSSTRSPIDVNIINTSYVFSFDINSDGTLINKPYRSTFVPTTTYLSFSSMNSTFSTTSNTWSIPITSLTNPNLPQDLVVTEYKYLDTISGTYSYTWENTYSYYYKLTGVYPYSTTASLGVSCSETPINFLQLYKVNFKLVQSSEKFVEKTVTYYDINGNWVFMNALYIDTQPTLYNYDRYIQSTLDGNAEFQSGYNAGKIDGINEGKEIGYQNGLDRGKDIGYWEGLADGIQQGSSGDYTFLGLMSAVIDAPIQAVSGLLNFTILGVDMSDFFFGILTLCLFIAVAKVVVKSVV